MTTTATVAVERPQYTITLGVAPGNGGGSGTPASTVTDETTWAVAKAVGTSTNYAREDHTHGTPAAPTAASVGAVPTGRTITATAPLTIDGGASADLSANRTVAIATATTTTQGSVELAEDGEVAADKVVQGSDSRLYPCATATITQGNNIQWANQPAAFTEFLGGLLVHPKMDTRAATHMELEVRVGSVAPVSGARFSVQYSIDNEANWRNLDVGSGSSSSIGGLIVTSSPFTIGEPYRATIALDAAAIAEDVAFRIVADGGDGATDPTFRGVFIRAYRA